MIRNKKNLLLLLLMYFLSLTFSGCSSNNIDKQESPNIGQLPNTPKTFSTTKKVLYNDVYNGHKKTFYCGCKFTSTNKVYLGTCNAEPRKNVSRAKRLEAEHVFPASHFGQHRQCWQQKLCTDSKGNKYGGRKCCNKIDPVFKTAHNDLHNLFPVIGEINGDRSNYNWGMIPGEKQSYGQCDIEVDSSIRRAEPPDNVKGNVARVYLYMSETYGIRLSDQSKQLYQAWNKLDPVDSWEEERNKRIKEAQGNTNRFIKRG